MSESNKTSSRKLKTGIVMDPIGEIKTYKDSSFAMLLEAQRRGHHLLYMEPRHLFAKDGRVYAHMQELEVRDNTSDWFSLTPAGNNPLDELDIVLMRRDPPFDMDYIYATYMLELAENVGTLIINRPQSLRDANEKFFINNFPQCCVPMMISSESNMIREFVSQHGHCVVKPLDGMGGESIFQVVDTDMNLNVILETITRHDSRAVMAQKYIDEITEGDKRILVVNGEPVPYALARFAGKGDFRGNLAKGGSSKGVPLSDRDRWICSQVAPELKKRGILFAGLDVIGDWLSEVNVTSPTCIRELDAEFGLNIAGQLFDAAEAALETQAPVKYGVCEIELHKNEHSEEMTAIDTSNDRFAVSILMALGLHAVVLLGVGFVLDFKPLTHPLETLDVVLVNWRSESAPDEADFLAQASQQGGGESTEASRPSQENTGASPGPAEGDDLLDQLEQDSNVKDAAREQVLIENDSAEFAQQITSIEQPMPPTPSAATLMQESMTMAKLQPGIQRDRESQSKLPRRKWISANTREYEFAAYMQAWVAKVERVGNLNYPEEVRRLKLVGDLIMTVGINLDGSVESIDIRRSSGMPELDQAATRIVRLAGPYSPLPEHINKSVDILHITRTWRFSRDFRGLN